MATYSELYKLANEDAVLKNRVIIGCLVAADAIRLEAGVTTNHANRLIWAKQAFTDPMGMGAKMLPAILATNKALAVAQIQGATDAQIQAAVDAAVDLFATGA